MCHVYNLKNKKMKDQALTHEESLQIIQSMINTAKNKITENGFYFLLWGMLVIIACIVQFAMIKLGHGEDSHFVWMIMPLVGVPVSVIYGYMQSKKEKTKSHTDRLYGALWLGFGITLGILMFVAINLKVSPIPFILALVGLATFVSGAVYKFIPLILGGIIFWISAIACFFFSGPEQLLIDAGATFLGYILPGIILWKKSKSEAYV